MANNHRIYYFSHLILFITGSTYLLDILTGGKLSLLFTLQPANIFKNLEWWRIFTFPLSVDSVESAILFLFTFFIFAPKLEDIFQQWLFPFMLAIIISLQGIILSILFWNSNFVITGMEGLSFFVLTVFSLLNIKKRLIILGKFYIRTVVFTFGMACSWFIFLFLHSLITENSMPLLEGLFSAIFGITVGLVIYIQMKYTKNIRTISKKNNNFEHYADNPTPEELSLALIANNELKRFNEKLQEEFTRSDEQFSFTEDKLNEILDKINDKGRDSLSVNEKRFLDDYSKQI